LIGAAVSYTYLILILLLKTDDPRRSVEYEDEYEF